LRNEVESLSFFFDKGWKFLHFATRP